MLRMYKKFLIIKFHFTFTEDLQAFQQSENLLPNLRHEQQQIFNFPSSDYIILAQAIKRWQHILYTRWRANWAHVFIKFFSFWEIYLTLSEILDVIEGNSKEILISKIFWVSELDSKLGNYVWFTKIDQQ